MPTQIHDALLLIYYKCSGLCFTECQKKETTVARHDQTILDQAAQAWLDASQSLTIVVIGKMGVGKSSLVNGILGKEVAPEGLGPYSYTQAVVPYTKEINNVTVTVIDTPGLQDPDIEDEVIFEQIRKVTGDSGVDLVLFCLKMSDRFTRGDQEMIQRTGEIFQRSIWNNTLLVLTFANEIKVDNAQEFEQLLQSWKDRLVKTLQKHAGLSPDDAKEVPVVSAGYEEPDLPHCEGWRDPNKCKNWINHVFLAASKRASTGKKLPLTLINRHRFKNWRKVEPSKDLHRIPHKKVIVLEPADHDNQGKSGDEFDDPADCVLYGMIGFLVGGVVGVGGAAVLAAGLNLLIPSVGIPIAWFAAWYGSYVGARVGEKVCQNSTLTDALYEILKDDYQNFKDDYRP